MSNYKPDEIRQIAYLHKKYLDKSFLSTLGTNFLFYLYKSLDELEYGILLSKKIDGVIVGFVSGTTDLRLFYKYFIKRYWLRAIFSICFVVLKKNSLSKIFENIRYSKKEMAQLDLPHCELLSIAVGHDYRRSGIASQLFDDLSSVFHNKGVDRFKIIVGEELLDAQKFYETKGCLKIGEFELHKGQRSIVYTCKTSKHKHVS